MWIGGVLREAGHEYFLQDESMGLGDNIFERTRPELERCRHIIAVFSPDYLRKEHTRREMNVRLYIRENRRAEAQPTSKKQPN